MPTIPRSHPRYRSLMVRAHLAGELSRGILAPEGLIAQGRGETFDYLLGERTCAFGRSAERAAAAKLLLSQRPVVSVNGNVAALAAREVALLAAALPSLKVEVNLFHRTPHRAELVAGRLHQAGVAEVLGVHPTARLRGLPSDRGWVDERGILAADTVLIPLEDGDRTQALARSGKFVIAIDLNPLSRTAMAANIPIVDELTRALTRLRLDIRSLQGKEEDWERVAGSVTGEGLRAQALAHIARRLHTLATRTPHP